MDLLAQRIVLAIYGRLSTVRKRSNISSVKRAGTLKQIMHNGLIECIPGRQEQINEHFSLRALKAVDGGVDGTTHPKPRKLPPLSFLRSSCPL